MLEFITSWYKRNFSDPQAVLLVLVLIIAFTVIITLGEMLAPVLAALVIAYLLEGIVLFMISHDAKRIRAVLLVFMTFMAFLVFLVFGIVPLLSKQVTELVRDLPNYIAHGQQVILGLHTYVSFISEEQAHDLISAINSEIAQLGQQLLTLSLSSIPGIITLAVYLVLVPLLVFFLLKDKFKILNWFSNYVPKEHGLTFKVWTEVDQQLGNYVRGKFWEIIVVGGVCYVTFGLLGLKYAILLSALVGLSVIVPYIGAAVVTIPVAVIGYFQWGWSSEFAYMMIAYTIIQALDGNLLVPLLFSEVVNLHPIAIIISILVFGGWWGFWGVFFAIPLATLVSAILSSWPQAKESPPEDEKTMAASSS